MKSTKLLLLLLLTIGFTACEDEEEEKKIIDGVLIDGPPADLHTKWEVAFSRQLTVGASDVDVCNRKTQQSDMYQKNTAVACQDEYLYDFSDPAKVVIHAGTPSCNVTPTATTKPYTVGILIGGRQTLTIGQKQYTIALLTKDTLILDYCEQTPAGLYQKNGIKLFRKQ